MTDKALSELTSLGTLDDADTGVMLYAVSAAGDSRSLHVGSVRRVLTAVTTFYVRTDGSDANDGSADTAAAAFATPRGAYDYICRNIDCAGYRVIIKMAAGTYTEVSQSRPNTNSTTTNVIYIGEWPVGGSGVTFTGDTATPSNVVWSGNPVWIGIGGYFTFEGMKWESITGIGGSSKGLFCNASGCTIIMGKMEYGVFGSSHFHMYGPSSLKCFSDYTISGSANRHIWLEGGCAICDFETHTCTLTGTPAFGHASGAFIMAEKDCSAFILDVTYSGAATGQKYVITDFATIDTVGTNEADLNDYFPGDVDGKILHRVGGSRELNSVITGGGTTVSPQIQSVARDGTAGVLAARFSNDAYGPQFTLLKSRSASMNGTSAPQSGDEIGRITWLNRDTTGTAIAAGIRAVCAGTAASNDAPTQLEFGTTPDGSGGTDTTWRWRIGDSGNLVALDTGYSIFLRGRTGEENGLNDFSSGAFTPALAFNGSSTGVTYTQRSGRFVKIGPQVTVWVWIDLSSNGSATGSAQITGLPFAVCSDTGYKAIGTMADVANITAGAGVIGSPFAYLEANDTRIDLKSTEPGGTEHWFTDSGIPDTAEFAVTITYFSD